MEPAANDLMYRNRMDPGFYVGADVAGMAGQAPATPASSRPTGGLSFEADIAPLQRQFFHQVEGSAMSSAQKNAAVFGMADTAMQILDQRQKMESREQQMRMRELQYKSTMMSIDAARRKAQTEQQMLASLPKVTAELDSILGNPDLDDIGKKQAVARWGIANSGMLSQSPAARIAFDSAANVAAAKDKDPLAFAAKVISLGLDPDSPMVANLPGATPEGIEAARQGTKAELAKMQARALGDTQEARRALLEKITSGLTKNIKFQTFENEGAQKWDKETGDITQRDQKDKDKFVVVGNTNMFADEGSEDVVQSVLQLANPEEVDALAKATNDRERLMVARTVRNRLYRELLGVPEPKSSKQAAFTRPSK